MANCRLPRDKSFRMFYRRVPEAAETTSAQALISFTPRLERYMYHRSPTFLHFTCIEVLEEDRQPQRLHANLRHRNLRSSPPHDASKRIALKLKKPGPSAYPIPTGLTTARGSGPRADACFRAIFACDDIIGLQALAIVWLCSVFCSASSAA